MIDTQVHQRLSLLAFPFSEGSMSIIKPLSPLYRSLQEKTLFITMQQTITVSSTPPQWLTLQRLGVTSNSD